MCICALVYAYLDLDPISLEFCFCLHFILPLSTFISMPPKYTRKQTESRDNDVGHEGGEESSFSEDTASAVSATSGITVTSDYLERILQANQQSMAALIAAMPAAPVPSSPSTCSPQIKPPRWSDEEMPYEYISKFEKAMIHNRVAQGEWGHLLPVYLSGRVQASLHRSLMICLMTMML